MEDELEALRQRRREELLAAARAAAARPTSLSAADFDAFLERHKLAMLDFWAAWCGPCRVTEPLVEEVAREWAGRIAVVKVNVDAEAALAERFRVLGIPAFLFFRNGRLAGRLVGVQPKAAFHAVAAELLAA